MLSAGEVHQSGDLSLLGGRAPALLPEILAIHLAPQLGGERAAKAGVLGAIEVEAAAHAAFVLRGHRGRFLQAGMSIRRRCLAGTSGRLKACSVTASWSSRCPFPRTMHRTQAG